MATKPPTRFDLNIGTRPTSFHMILKPSDLLSSQQRPGWSAAGSDPSWMACDTSTTAPKVQQFIRSFSGPQGADRPAPGGPMAPMKILSKHENGVAGVPSQWDRTRIAGQLGKLCSFKIVGSSGNPSTQIAGKNRHVVMSIIFHHPKNMVNLCKSTVSLSEWPIPLLRN